MLNQEHKRRAEKFVKTNITALINNLIPFDELYLFILL